MKKALPLIAVYTFLSTLSSFAQQLPVVQPDPLIGDTADVPYYVDMMKDPNANFFQTQRAFELYWENRTITPGCGYKQFKRWEYRMKDRVDEFGNKPAPNKVAKLAAYKQTKSLSGNWNPLGPNFDLTTQTGDFPGTGRLNTIAFHPSDPNTFYVGAPAGGLWRTTDYGVTWTPLTDQIPTLGISAVLVHQDNPNTIYVGTGDRDSDDAPGLGVWSSTDNGVTWTQTNVGMGDVVVNALIQDYTDGNILIAATDGGIFRSTDAGANWTMTSAQANSFKDIKMHPTDNNIIYSALGRIYRSDDNGVSWTMLTGMPNANRVVLAVSASTPDVVYATLANQRSLLGFYRSDDAGQTFNEIIDYPNILGYQADGSDVSGGQSWYDLALTASPTNPGEIYSAGINVWKSLDSGATWQHYTNGVHIDMHAIEFSPLTGDLLLGNDGGIYIKQSTNGSWKDISTNMVAGQLYKLGQSAYDLNKTLNGFQDNGTGEFDGTHWRRVTGGDGMECMYDPTDDNYAYSTLQYGSIYRRVGTGSFKKFAGENKNGIDEQGGWVTPYQVSPNNGNVMFAGYSNMWRTTNLRESDQDDIVWIDISNGAAGGTSTTFDVVAVSLVDSNRVYAAKNGILYYSFNAMDSAQNVTWSQIASMGGASGNITDVLCHPFDADILYATKGTDVVKSVDGGQTWSMLGTGLPGLGLNCIMLDTSTVEDLYVGTEAGVLYKNSSMSDWIDFSNGLPMVLDIREINIFYGNATDGPRIRLASYGRGLWESDLYGSSTVHFPTTAIINKDSSEFFFEAYKPIQLRIGFYKNLVTKTMTGFDVADIASNATISNFTIDGNDFLITIEPGSGGNSLWVTVPSAVAQDSNGLDNLPSDTFWVNYRDIPTQLGFEGPGGVGSPSDLAVWLRADKELLDNPGGTTVANDGDPVGHWGDLFSNGLSAIADADSVRPLYRAAIMNGRPGIQFEPTNDTIGSFLTVNNVSPGQHFSAFVVVQCDDNVFNDHGWMASSREENGFILHNRRNTNSFYAHVRNDNDNTDNGFTVQVDDVDNPHIYGVVWSDNQFGSDIHTVADNQDVHSYEDLTNRGNSTIDLQLGKDRDDRPGDGYMGEHIIYNVALRTAQLRIVKNYMAARYGINLFDQTLFAHGTLYGNDVAGIGQHDYTDYHTDAKGLGIIRMHTPTAMDDNEYLLWGSNGAAADSWQATSYEGVERIPTAWQVDETGDLGSVSLQIEQAELPALGQGEVYAILTAADATFDAPDNYYILSGSTTLLTSLDFTDDHFFTVVKGTEEALNKILFPYDELGLEVYPNPSPGNFTVLITNPNPIQGQLRIYNNLGQIIETIKVDAGVRYEYSTTFLSAGIYHVDFESGEENLSLKVMVY